MTVLALFVALLLAATLAIGLVWRYAYFCPSWLSPLLENPYVELVAGSALLVERAGVGPGMRVLDAGCGPGRITLQAAERCGAAGGVVGLDIQQAMLDKLERRIGDRCSGNIRTVHAGLGEGKLPLNEFDVAFLVTVLGEVPDKPAALAEIYRSLRPGGVLSITEVLPDPHYQPMQRVRRLALAAGFRQQQVFTGVLSYTMNLIKEPTA